MRKFNGFTLIELLIVLGIIAILAAIAYPCYTGHMIKVRRNVAETILFDAAGRLEQYYTSNHKFSGATLAGLGVKDTAIKNYYALTLTADTDAYSLRADPLGQQLTQDLTCGSLILDQQGNKMITGSGLSEECWN